MKLNMNKISFLSLFLVFEEIMACGKRELYYRSKIYGIKQITQIYLNFQRTNDAIEESV